MTITSGGPEHIYESETSNGEITAAIGPREEIIRCRDCKHFREAPMANGSKGHRCSGVFTFIEPDPSGFCAWAKWREEES